MSFSHKRSAAQPSSPPPYPAAAATSASAAAALSSVSASAAVPPASAAAASAAMASPPAAASAEPWNLSDTDAARCAAILTLSGQPGDFVVARSPARDGSTANSTSTQSTSNSSSKDSWSLTIWVNSEGLPRTCRCVLIPGPKPNSEHPAIVRSIDVVNEDMTVQWCDGIFIASKRVSLADIFARNPRLCVHPVAVAIKMTNSNKYRLGHGFDPDAPEFPSVAALISHYQRHEIKIRSFQRDGDFTRIKLTNDGASWNLVRRGFVPAELRVVKADWKIPLVMSRSEVDKLMTGHWCQAGDLIIRYADETEKNDNPRAVVYFSMLTAIRVHHIAILQSTEGFYHTSRQPSMVFATLGQLVDYMYMNLRLENIPCRRLVVPNAYLEIQDAIEQPQPKSYMAFGRNDIGFDLSSTSSNDADNAMGEEESVPEHMPRKQPRRSLNGLPFQRRGISINALVSEPVDPAEHEHYDNAQTGSHHDAADDHTTGPATSDTDDDETLPYNTDVRDVEALVHNYQDVLQEPRKRNASPAPQAQTSFVLGLADPRGLAQEALLDHFAPLADPTPSMQGLTNLDRMPLPRTPARPITSLGSSLRPPFHGGDTGGGGSGAGSGRLYSSASAPARLNRWPQYLDSEAQDEIDDVFG